MPVALDLLQIPPFPIPSPPQPCLTAGPSAEALHPLASLPGRPEAQALSYAASPQREQASSVPTAATSDVWSVPGLPYLHLLQHGIWQGQGLGAHASTGAGPAFREVAVPAAAGSGAAPPAVFLAQLADLAAFEVMQGRLAG